MEYNSHEYLKGEVKKKLDDFRAAHVLSVYEECKKLADIFKLSESEKGSLLNAVLLHDITKPLSTREHIELAQRLGITLENENILCPKTLHAVTGAAYAKKYYADYVNDESYKAILCHTTGKVNMSLCEKLLYIADYIEPTRKFNDCIQVRERFYSSLDQGTPATLCLDRTIVYSLDLTINQLIAEGARIHPDTVKTRNFLLEGQREQK